MFTDMVGYTALMQKNEEKARELIERKTDLVPRNQSRKARNDVQTSRRRQNSTESEGNR